MLCPNCKIEMEYSTAYIEMESGLGVDIIAYICPNCLYPEVVLN